MAATTPLQRPPGMAPGQIPPQMAQQLMQPPMPPATAALLDSLPFTPVPFEFRKAPPRPEGAPPAHDLLVCKEHGRDVCKACDVDFSMVNIANLYMPMLAPGMTPPPPNVQYPKQAEVIKDLRERGNAEFKASRFPAAIDLYTKSIERAMQRPPWELTNFCREEATSALLNRSAAFGSMKNWPAAYADAHACTQLNRTLPKAYFRKAKALVGLERYQDAYDAVMLGLRVAPDNTELQAYAEEIKGQIRSER